MEEADSTGICGILYGILQQDKIFKRYLDAAINIGENDGSSDGY